MLTLEDVKRLIEPLAFDANLKRVIVFGSYARDEQTDKSDIDIVIDSGGMLRGLAFFDLAYRLDSLFPIKTDIFELCEVKNPSQTFTNIQKEGVVIYEG